MKVLHLSDLHLGKRVNGYSMIEDQEYILRQILKISDAEGAETVIIAGDIYDKPVPSVEAVKLFDGFLNELSVRSLKVLIIYGNHDSPERLTFGESFFKRSDIHISPVYDGLVTPIKLSDSYGEINFWLLPFVKPSQVSAALGDESITTYTSAIKAAIAKMEIDTSTRNILVTHQFVAGAETSDSEELSAGGADSVDPSAFAPFDYTALGHLHSPQSAGSETVRYCGSPLKYSLSEISRPKSATLIDFKSKGDLNVSIVPLTPLHDLRRIKGSYSDLALKSNYENTATEDYLHIVLTDEDDVPDAIGRLRAIYPNIMKLEYDNSRTRHRSELTPLEESEKFSPLELFSEFYLKQNGCEMSEAQKAFLKKIILKTGEG